MKLEIDELSMDKQTVLSNVQKQILIGSLLGDGHLETQNHGKTFRFTVVQSSKKALYFQYLYDQFQDLITTPVYTRTYQTRQGFSSTLRFTTRTNTLFTPYGFMFYCGGVKQVPACIEEILTPLGLSIWYMDDGSVKSSQSKGVYFNTQSFSVSDIDRLCLVLKTKFQIDSWKRQDSGNYRIYVSGKSYERLGSLITPYFTDDMWYKWPCPRKSKKRNE